MTYRHLISSGVLLFTALVLSAPEAFAQAGAIAGVAKDTTGAVLPGVTVEASSPSLIEKVRSAVTDAEGQYKIVNLPPGTYSVTFTLAGFSTMKRDGVQISVAFTALVNGDLRIGNIAETVTVSGASPLVDVQNVVQQRVVTRDVIDALPVAKTMQSVAVLVPGVTVAGSATGATGQDVGGSVGERHVYLSVHGSRGLEMPLVWDGMRVNNMNFLGGGFGTSLVLNAGSVDEISIEVGALSTESETSGVRANVIPKAGGNTYAGFFEGNYANGSMQANNVDANLQARGLVGLPAIDHIFDINPALGGPIRRDQLWFYGAFRYWGNYDRPPGAFFMTDPLAYVYTPDLTRPGVNETWNRSENLRLTWQASPRNKITGYFDDQQRCTCHWTESSTRSPEAATVYSVTPNWITQIKWNAPVTNRLLFEAGFTYHPETYIGGLEPGVSPTTYPVVDLNTNVAFRAGQIFTNQKMLQYSSLFAVAYVTGSHAFKFGAQTQNGYSEQTSYSNQDATLFMRNGVPTSVTLYATPYTVVTRLKANIGLFAQDQWTLKQLTLNLGARFDYLNAYDPAQDVAATRYVPARSYGEVDNVPNWKDFTTRLGASYDLFGNGKTALKVNVGRYLQAMATSVAALNNPLNTSANSASAVWNDTNHDFIPQLSELGPLSPANFGQPNILTRYDPSLTQGFGARGYDWEFASGVQHEIRPGLSASVTYTRHWFGNFSVVQNQALSSTDFGSYCVTVPVDPRLPGGGGNQLCGFVDVSPSKVGVQSNLIQPANRFGDQQDVYDGVELSLSTRLGKGIVMSGGVNVARERTNNCFLLNNPTLQFISGASTQVANGGLAAVATPTAIDPRLNSFCDVRPPFQPQGKAFVVYPLPWWGIQGSLAYQSIPGPPILASGVFTSAQIAPSLGRNLSTGPNGTVILNMIPTGQMYGDRLNQVDVRVTKSIRAGHARIQPQLDLYNLFNANPVTNLNTRYGASWLQPVYILPGRLLKLGVELNF
jgi:hypothetical protein